MADKKAVVQIRGQAPFELPIYSGTAGTDVIDVRALGSKDTSPSIRALWPRVHADQKSPISMVTMACCYTGVTQ